MTHPCPAITRFCPIMKGSTPAITRRRPAMTRGRPAMTGCSPPGATSHRRNRSNRGTTVRRDGPAVTTTLSETMIGRPVSTSAGPLQPDRQTASPSRSTTVETSRPVVNLVRIEIMGWDVSTDRSARLRLLSFDEPTGDHGVSSWSIGLRRFWSPKARTQTSFRCQSIVLFQPGCPTLGCGARREER